MDRRERRRGTLVSTVILLLAAVSAAAGPARQTGVEATTDAETTMADPRMGHLVRALEMLSEAPDIDLAGDVIPALIDAAMTDDDWQGLFHTFFETHAFTDTLAQFWDYSLRHDQGRGPRLALVSGFCAGAALARGLVQLTATAETVDYASLMNALRWPERLLPALDAQQRRTVFSALVESLDGAKADLTALLRPTTDGGPPRTRLAMQLALTLGAYAGRSPHRRDALDEALRLPNDMRTFWRSHGILLFDNGALEVPQLLSLDNLVRLVPPQLHAIRAFVVPGAVPVPGLVSVGQIVSIPPVPIDAVTDRAEFDLRGPRPVAAQFTVNAAVQIVRAIQDVQFSRRPWLAERRDALLERARVRRVNYIRRTVPPEVYQDDPDELLPSTAYLWFIDSPAAFQVALDYGRSKERGALTALLLLADLLSNGTDTSLMFTIDPQGGVTGDVIAIERADLDLVPMGPLGAVNAAPVSGLRVLDDFWAFRVDQLGGVVGLAGRGPSAWREGPPF